MIASLSLFCPSRGRPEAAHELLANFDATRATESELVFCVDEDDPTKNKYPPQSIIGPSTGDPVGPLNRAALSSTSDIVGFIGDDSRFETDGWDRRVIQALEEAGGGFCWTSEGHDKPWPSTVFVSTKIVKALGWLALPTVKRGYFDAVWIHLARLTGRAVVLRDVMIRHVNEYAGGAPPEVIARDELAFKHWYEHQLRDDARKVRAAL